MKKLITLTLWIVWTLYLCSKAASSGPLKWTLLAVCLAAIVVLMTYDVAARRRGGQSWNQALEGDVKTFTGNVWLDLVVFTAMILAGVLLLYGEVAGWWF